MNGIKGIVSGIFLLFIVITASGQSFSVQYDTVRYEYKGTGIANVADPILNTSTSVNDSLTVAWKVQETDFPADWVAASGICDNRNIYTFIGIWPNSALMYSNKYPQGPGDFHLSTNLSNVQSSGCHYVTVKMYNYNMPGDSTQATFLVCRSSVSVSNINKQADDVVLYPNPAQNEVNVLYDATADIKSIAVYNIIGKMAKVYRVTNNTSANLDISTLPSGVYFVRMMNSNGAVAASRKFTKQ